MSREELLALAERCEQATGPDRELDCAIRMAVYAPEGATMEQSPINGNWCIYSGTSFRTGKPALWESHLGRNQAFTASLDAAMSLVPDGCLAMVKHLWDGPKRCGYAFVSQYTPDAEECDGKMWVADYTGCAETPALALCAASLRSRAAMGEGL